MYIKLEKPIAFFPALSKELGGIKEAIFYQQLAYWEDKGKNPDGWIYKTKQEFEDETTLSRDEQDRIRQKLENDGWIKTKVMLVSGHPTLHYKLTDRKEEIPLLEKRKSHVSISGKPTNYITDNTTDNTTYKEIYKERLELTKDQLDELQEKFPTKTVVKEYESARDWLASNGRKYKDYLAFFRNWLRRAKDTREPPKIADLPVIEEISDEQRAKNLEKLSQMRGELSEKWKA